MQPGGNLTAHEKNAQQLKLDKVGWRRRRADPSGTLTKSDRTMIAPANWKRKHDGCSAALWRTTRLWLFYCKMQQQVMHEFPIYTFWAVIECLPAFQAERRHVGKYPSWRIHQCVGNKAVRSLIHHATSFLTQHSDVSFFVSLSPLRDTFLLLSAVIWQYGQLKSMELIRNRIIK